MFNSTVIKIEERMLHLLKSHSTLAVLVSISASFAEQVAPPFTSVLWLASLI